MRDLPLNLLSSRHFHAELERTVLDLTAARAESNRDESRSDNDSALHSLISC